MSKNESIRTTVGDVGVHQDDLNANAGKWIAGTFTTSGATYVCTAAVTVLGAYINLTAAASSNGVVYIGTTASATAILACSSTVAMTVSNHFTITTSVSSAIQSVVKTASQSTIVEITAGGSIKISASGTGAAGKYYIQYITTPT